MQMHSLCTIVLHMRACSSHCWRLHYLFICDSCSFFSPIYFLPSNNSFGTSVNLKETLILLRSEQAATSAVTKLSAAELRKGACSVAYRVKRKWEAGHSGEKINIASPNESHLTPASNLMILDTQRFPADATRAPHSFCSAPLFVVLPKHTGKLKAVHNFNRSKNSTETPWTKREKFSASIKQTWGERSSNQADT